MHVCAHWLRDVPRTDSVILGKEVEQRNRVF
jgi:hypothetical protein